MSEIEHNERAFQQQEKIFCARKVAIKKFTNKSGRQRYWKNVGLGFKTPKSAIEGTYVDKKCPFTGNVSIRGRILRGVIKSGKMKRSLIIRRNYLHFHPKYMRYEKRHHNMAAHVSPCFEFQAGDEAIVGECRPLSKTIRFNVLKINPKSKKAAHVIKSFTKF
eukprot:NODE_3217_length_691_cov_1299.336449_g2287_i0.p2 GENE.NODE_3217_length_691_cov_1299.336449_g2287_i0~~NODE_3217_length_691_cov_1299.336449_g2287_i0.p2  ORF type:complete len:181 (+),score=81.31 NODE_3217_length_691_cov_1299.336449_g2287_i0:55-543(+)